MLNALFAIGLSVPHEGLGSLEKCITPLGRDDKPQVYAYMLSYAN